VWRARRCWVGTKGKLKGEAAGGKKREEDFWELGSSCISKERTGGVCQGHWEKRRTIVPKEGKARTEIRDPKAGVRISKVDRSLR